MSDINKTNFILYKDSQEVIESLTDEQAGKLFKAIFKYVNGRNISELDPVTNIVFLMIKQQLERDLKKYKKRVKANQENGKKGGRPKNPENPMGYLETQDNPSKPKKADSDSDNDSVSDRDNVNDKENIDIKSFVNNYQNLSQIKIVTDKRKKSFNARIKEHGLEVVEEVFSKANTNEFLTGNNDRNWKADFDWIINPNNFAKILENKYQQETKQEQEIIQITGIEECEYE